MRIKVPEDTAFLRLADYNQGQTRVTAIDDGVSPLGHRQRHSTVPYIPQHGNIYIKKNHDINCLCCWYLVRIKPVPPWVFKGLTESNISPTSITDSLFLGRALNTNSRQPLTLEPAVPTPAHNSCFIFPSHHSSLTLAYSEKECYISGFKLCKLYTVKTLWLSSFDRWETYYSKRPISDEASSRNKRLALSLLAGIFHSLS